MDRVEVIVVGAGLAGLAAAIVLAEAGVDVLVVERGASVGAKNVSGGRLYLEPVRSHLPAELWKEARFERKVVKEQLTLTSGETSVTTELHSPELASSAPSYTVLRALFDPWLAAQAEQRGAMIACGYKVDDLLSEDGKITGVRCGEDEIGADVVICCEGALGFLSLEAGLAKPRDPAHMALGVKQIIELDEETIDQRFGLAPGEGAARLFVGELTGGLSGGGFLYTNKTSLSLGLVLGVEDLSAQDPDRPLRPGDLLESFKARPEIRSLIAGGRPIEYSAHLVHEAGHAGVSKLVRDGLVIAGDAAGLTLNLGFTIRGMDLALISGALAARAVIEAKQAGDFSAAALASYEQRLNAEPARQDLKTFEHMPGVVGSSNLQAEMPRLACEIFEGLYRFDARPKTRIRPTVTRALRQGLFQRGLLRDVLKAWRV